MIYLDVGYLLTISANTVEFRGEMGNGSDCVHICMHGDVFIYAGTISLIRRYVHTRNYACRCIHTLVMIFYIKINKKRHSYTLPYVSNLMIRLRETLNNIKSYQ